MHPRSSAPLLSASTMYMHIWVTKFKEHVDRQMFEVVIQATAGKRIVARETIKPFRKDVLQKLHASDVSRRRKLLEKQKEGRKKLKGT